MFARAVQKFANKLGKTLPKMRPSRFQNGEPLEVQKRIQRLRNKCSRRTTSFAGIKIIEESDEEETADVDMDAQETKTGAIKKVSSKHSLLSMS